MKVGEMEKYFCPIRSSGGYEIWVHKKEFVVLLKGEAVRRIRIRLEPPARCLIDVHLLGANGMIPNCLPTLEIGTLHTNFNVLVYRLMEEL